MRQNIFYAYNIWSSSNIALSITQIIYSDSWRKRQKWFSFRNWYDEEGSWGSESSCHLPGWLCHHPGASQPYHRVCKIWWSPFLPQIQQKGINNTTSLCHSYNRPHACMHTQFTGSSTKEDHDAYVELGNVSSVDLISFAYQIASGMVCYLF